MTKQQALDYFVSRGWTVEQAAGIVANLWAESGLNPAAVGDGGAAYGIAQWHPDRQAGFQALYGRPIQGSSIEDQLAWVDEELKTTEQSAGNALRACVTASQAGACVSEMYERPADRVGEAAKRAALAESLVPNSGTTVPVPGTQPAPKGQRMDPLSLLTFLGPIVAKLLPVVGGFLTSEKAKTNLDKVGTIFSTITQATGTPNLQAAVEAMQDPVTGKEAVATARSAIVNSPEISQFLEVGGGFAAARENDLKMQAAAQAPDSRPFYQTSAVFWVSVLLLPLVYWLVGSLIVGGTPIPSDAPWYIQIFRVFGGVWNGESRSGGFNLVIGLVLGGICGVYYGISVTQAKQSPPSSGNTDATRG